MKTLVIFGCIFVGLVHTVRAQPYTPRALDNVTITGAPIVAVAGPANGCNISSTSGLVIDPVGVPTGTASGTAQLQAANATPYQCGPIAAGTSVRVACSGGGSCTITGVRW